MLHADTLLAAPLLTNTYRRETELTARGDFAKMYILTKLYFLTIMRAR
jgi:hypothetical protein